MEVYEVMFAIGKKKRKFVNFWPLEATILTIAKNDRKSLNWAFDELSIDFLRLSNTLNPRPAGVWLVTRPAGGGGKGPPWDLPNYWTDFQISNAIR